MMLYIQQVLAGPYWIKIFEDVGDENFRVSHRMLGLEGTIDFQNVSV